MLFSQGHSMGSGHKLMNSYHVPPRIVLRTTCMHVERQLTFLGI
jgi:hypothetical protein